MLLFVPKTLLPYYENTLTNQSHFLPPGSISPIVTLSDRAGVISHLHGQCKLLSYLGHLSSHLSREDRDIMDRRCTLTISSLHHKQATACTEHIRKNILYVMN